jgi:hypothetical protein
MGSVTSKIGGVIGGLFGGGKKPKDPTGDGGMANAAAINVQRDTILQSDIWKYYVAQGKLNAVAGPGPSWLDHPAVDAFGSAEGALAKIAGAIETLKNLIKAEPIVQKHLAEVNRVYAEYPGGVFGPMTGSGNVPEAIRNLNSVLTIVAEAEVREQQAAQEKEAQREVLSSGGSVTPSGALIPAIAGGGKTTAGTAPTGDIAALTASIQELVARYKPGAAPGVADMAPQTAGFDAATIRNVAPIVAGLVLFGFIFSDFGLKGILRK